MADLKLDRYYDLCCDNCYCMWSTDFDGGRGMYHSAAALRAHAKIDGWGIRESKNLCPKCMEEYRNGCFELEE